MAGSIFKVFDNGEGTIVAVGQSGLLITSVDGGVTWVTRNSGTSQDLYGVAYGSAYGTEKFCVVGEGGLIITSTDLATWAAQTSFTVQNLYSIAYGGVFLAVGASGAFGISNDLGTTWEAKASGTIENLIDITADLGAYLIVGENDTVIVGDISTLEFDILIEEGIQFTGTLANIGSFQHAITENLVIVSEENWEHDALGAGTTITIGGTNQFVFITETLILVDPASAPTGTYHHSITESMSLINVFVEEHHKNVFGDLAWPMFEINGTILAGNNLGGNIIWPLFELVGVITSPAQGVIVWPMFDIDGIILPEGLVSGNIDWPMFILNGEIVDSGRFNETTDYEVWVLNVESSHHSTYTNWQINSYGLFNGEEIVATPDGLFRLTETDDGDAGDPIQGKIYWVPSDLTSSNQKALESAFIRMRGENDAIRFVTIHDETEQRTYVVSMNKTSDGNTVKRIPLPRGLQGNLWQFGIENVGYGKLDLFEIEILSVKLNRKIR